MSKQVTFIKVYTISINIVKQDDIINIELVYGLEDDTGVKWPVKRLHINQNELTTNQLTKIIQIITVAENKAKNVEEI